jgi:hypothetical protein
MVELRWMGGALARPASLPDAVAGRTAACSVYAHGPLDPPGAAGPSALGVPGAVAGVIDALAPWSLGGALPNFAGAEPPGALWSARDRARLRVLRRAVDPDEMFAAAPLP